MITYKLLVIFFIQVYFTDPKYVDVFNWNGWCMFCLYIPIPCLFFYWF